MAKIEVSPSLKTSQVSGRPQHAGIGVIKLTFMINSSPPSAAHMCQWIGSASVQIMACRLFGAKALSKPKLGYCQLDLKKQTVIFYQNTKFFIHENSYEYIVYEMTSILSRGWWVKSFCSFSVLSKHWLDIWYDIHIRQVMLQLSSSHTCQVWTWF